MKCENRCTYCNEASSTEFLVYVILPVRKQISQVSYMLCAIVDTANNKES